MEHQTLGGGKGTEFGVVLGAGLGATDGAVVEDVGVDDLESRIDEAVNGVTGGDHIGVVKDGSVAKQGAGSSILSLFDSTFPLLDDCGGNCKEEVPFESILIGVIESTLGD